ncbi:MAG: long-chain N-acyl amino acid synthase [Pirellulales bacterium]|nr:long-chain N-acyl amino acid synthase [Pirellulales bacterium]
MSTIRLGASSSQKTIADVQYRIAATREQRAAAFRLVHYSYLRAGLTEPNWHEMRVTPYHLLPTTEVFVAICDDEVISTVTLVLDGELGLPMDSVYKQEIMERRARGLWMGELSCLADRRNDPKRFFPIFVRLCRLAAQHARYRGVHEFVAAVHPRHARFYKRYMAFEPIGDERAYPSARNHPAVALSLNFARVDRERPRSWDTFFGQPIPHAQLKPQPIPQSQCDYFRNMLDSAFEPMPLGGMDDQADDSRTEMAGAAVA